MNFCILEKSTAYLDDLDTRHCRGRQGDKNPGRQHPLFESAGSIQIPRTNNSLFNFMTQLSFMAQLNFMPQQKAKAVA